MTLIATPRLRGPSERRPGSLLRRPGQSVGRFRGRGRADSKSSPSGAARSASPSGEALLLATAVPYFWCARATTRTVKRLMVATSAAAVTSNCVVSIGQM
jgi:hypothetical protein